MKYCQHCGSEVMDDAVVCPKCGCSVASTNISAATNRSNGFAIAGFVLSFFIPLLGLIFGGVGLGKSKEFDGNGKGLSIAALVISGIWFLIQIICLIAMFVIAGNAAR